MRREKKGYEKKKQENAKIKWFDRLQEPFEELV